MDLYPKTLIQVVVQELESDRPLLSLALNCICAALLDSGISMSRTFAATTVAVLASGEVVANPSDDQASDEASLVTLVQECGTGDLLAAHLQGRPLDRQVLQRCVQAAAAECERVAEALAAAANGGSSSDRRHSDSQ